MVEAEIDKALTLLREAIVSAAQPQPTAAPAPTSLSAFAKRELRNRRLLWRALSNGKGIRFACAQWDMLLDLYVADSEGKKVTKSSLCLASGVPATTALRYVNVLCADGLIAERSDESDKRLTVVMLTKLGRDGIEAYLSEAAKGGGN